MSWNVHSVCCVLIYSNIYSFLYTTLLSPTLSFWLRYRYSVALFRVPICVAEFSTCYVLTNDDDTSASNCIEKTIIFSWHPRQLWWNYFTRDKSFILFFPQKMCSCLTFIKVLACVVLTGCVHEVHGRPERGKEITLRRTTFCETKYWAGPWW